MAFIYISEAEAASSLPSLLNLVRRGQEVVIENGILPPAILRTLAPPRCSISECIALAKKHEEETGEAPLLDPDFACDVEEIVKVRKPWTPPSLG